MVMKKIPITLGIAIILFSIFLFASQSVALNSDTVNALLQGKAVANGNVLLHGWTFSNVSFYTTDLLLYGLAIWIGGFHFAILRIVPSIIYTLIVLLSLTLINKPNRRLRIGVLLLLLAFPIEDLAFTAFSSMDHTDALMFALIAIVLAKLSDKLRIVPYVLVPIILAYASIGDTLTLFIGVIPIAIASLIRRKWTMGILSVIAGIVAHVVAASIHSFKLYPTYYQFAQLSDLPHHFSYAIHGVLSFTGADFFGDNVGAQSLLSALHIVGTIAVVYVIYRAIRQWRALDYISLILVIGIVLDMAAFIFSTFPVNNGSDRYLLAFMVFGSILVARHLDWLTVLNRFKSRQMYITTGIVVLVYAISVFAFPTFNPNQSERQVVNFLEQHNMTNGYGSYWSANIMTALSNGKVHIAPTYVTSNSKISEYDWESDDTWYTHPTNFLVFDTQTGFNSQEVVNTFGKPSQTYNVGQDSIYVWDHNITPQLQHAPLEGGIAWG